MRSWHYEFNPHPKQQAALQSPAREILYGGSVYSGKSEVLLAACIDLCTMVPNAMALLIRRTTDEQRELKRRILARLPTYIAKLNRAENTFYFFNGSQLVMRFLDSEDDATKVQGFEAQLAAFDELTHYDQSWYAEVVSRLRATGQVKEDMDRLGFVPRALSASNPGGRGHAWVKQRFIDPAPANQEFIGDDNTHRLFLQATIWDNPYADVEDYIQNSLGPLDPERREALLYGNWDVLKGVRFSQWRRGRHVISPDDLPPSMLSGERVISVDYGFDAPFAAVWLNKLPNGLTVVYRELYATDLTAIQQAELIKSMTTPEEWEQGVTVIMDPSMWGRRDASAPKTQNPLAPSVSSPAHDYQTVLGITPRKANNERVMGAARIDEKLRVHPDGWPRLLVYDTCIDLIRTLPALMRSKVRPEDIQQNPKQEDHLYDALRYGLMYLEGKSPVATGEDDRRPTPGTLTGGLAAKKW